MISPAKYAEWASLAYFDPTSVNLGRDTLFIEADNAEGYIFKYKNFDVISLRGTQPGQWKDIAADLKFWRMDPAGTGERIHSGFWREAFSLLPAVIRNTDPEKPVCITGHSLGGGMAVIMAGFLMKMGYDVVDLYTFGQPRVGNNKFVKRIEAGCNWQRYVNNNDVVPTVPPKVSGLMFKDGGTLQYINANAQVIENSTWKERMKDKLLGIKNSWKQGKYFDSFADHSMSCYKEHLIKNNKE